MDLIEKTSPSLPPPTSSRRCLDYPLQTSPKLLQICPSRTKKYRRNRSVSFALSSHYGTSGTRIVRHCVQLRRRESKEKRTQKRVSIAARASHDTAIRMPRLNLGPKSSPHVHDHDKSSCVGFGFMDPNYTSMKSMYNT